MRAMPTDIDVIRPRRDDFMQRRFRVERRAELVKVRHLLFGASAHCAAIRLDLAKNQAQHRRFTGTIRADQTHAVTTHDAPAEIVDDLAATKRFRDINEVSHQCAGGFARINAHGYLALLVTTRGPLRT